MTTLPSPYYQDERVTIYHGDTREIGPLLPLDKFDLIAIDPPYGMGKEKEGVQNDNIYGPKLDAFLMECWQATRPALKANASAYIWGKAEDLHRLWFLGGLRDSEMLLYQNCITWRRGITASPTGNQLRSPTARNYCSEIEHCLFFMLGKQNFGSLNACDYHEGYEPVRAYLAGECDRMKWKNRDILRLCGVGMYSHWFSKSQWAMIPEAHYQTLASASAGLAFQRPWAELKQIQLGGAEGVQGIRDNFYNQRSYFDNTHDAMTDLWPFKRPAGLERPDHPTPKPLGAMARIVQSSCPPNGWVLDSFAGSGTTGRVCKDLGRNCVIIELEERHCAEAAARMRQESFSFAEPEPLEQVDTAAFL